MALARFLASLNAIQASCALATEPPAASPRLGLLRAALGPQRAVDGTARGERSVPRPMSLDREHDVRRTASTPNSKLACQQVPLGTSLTSPDGPREPWSAS
eukprot:5073497-Pyramimonas_sp.AAC.1